jgi:hypothetical protein
MARALSGRVCAGARMFRGDLVDALWHGMPRGLEQRLVIALILAWLLLASGWLCRHRAA